MDQVVDTAAKVDAAIDSHQPKKIKMLERDCKMNRERMKRLLTKKRPVMRQSFFFPFFLFPYSKRLPVSSVDCAVQPKYSFVLVSA
jgi:hypothetical protein